MFHVEQRRRGRCDGATESDVSRETMAAEPLVHDGSQEMFHVKHRETKLQMPRSNLNQTTN
jgi:hypothetical protein